MCCWCFLDAYNIFTFTGWEKILSKYDMYKYDMCKSVEPLFIKMASEKLNESIAMHWVKVKIDISCDM